MNSEKKEYNIGGRVFQLKDLTRRERRLVDSYLSEKYFDSEGNFNEDLSEYELKEFLNLILETTDGHPGNIDIEELKESVEYEITADFFLKTIRSLQNFTQKLKNLTPSTTGIANA